VRGGNIRLGEGRNRKRLQWEGKKSKKAEVREDPRDSVCSGGKVKTSAQIVPTTGGEGEKEGLKKRKGFSSADWKAMMLRALSGRVFITGGSSDF